ncbi:hypothetical protein [Bacteroides sp.]|uniref:hypothetical protein n=1 Tax=Bacteroides sp. TaxID=29523 RepID=UPI0026292DFC|nr:hypothetical protein [Bacteroides sp.]MDD3039013.1 hypothetical protein [Bacteroides sp.]
MPTVQDAIQITVSMDTSAPPLPEWGVAAIIGEKSILCSKTGDDPAVYSFGGSHDGSDPLRVLPTTNLNTYFGSPDSSGTPGTDGAVVGSKITKSLQSLFAQGVNTAYAIPVISAVPGKPTATEFETAINKLTSLALDKNISGCVCAMIPANYSVDGVTGIDILKKLKTFCDNAAHQLLFTFTNEPDANTYKLPGATKEAFYKTTSPLGYVNELGSRNGLFCVNADDAVTDDIAAVAIGSLFVQKPWSTLMWKNTFSDTNQILLSEKVYELENDCKANTIIEVAGAKCMSNGLTTLGDPYKFIDITRTQYYVVHQLKSNLTILRKNTAKIPYTQSGISLVGSYIMSALDRCVQDGALAEYTLTMPSFSQCTVQERAARTLNNIGITCRIAGDIHEFNVNLSITV